jgi:predicted alpha/beta-hydrolase family hydrolase
VSTTTRDLSFVASESAGNVSAIFERPPGADLMLLLAHGAGAGMRHAFLNALAARLVDRSVAVFRYQFPYMEQGSRRPSPKPLLLATVRSAIREASKLAGDLPLFAGGKSMGGRMTSLALAGEAEPNVRGLVFFGFPLHAAGRAGAERGDHLAEVTNPLLFLQGTRDALADLERLGPLVHELGDRATMHVVEGADHSFHVLKRSGRDDEQVLDELADAARVWMESITVA